MTAFADSFRRHLLLSLGATVIYLALYALPPMADLYASTDRFYGVRALRAEPGPFSSAIYVKVWIVALPELASDEAAPLAAAGFVAVPLVHDRPLSPASTLADLFTGTPPEIHGLSLSGHLDRLGCENLVEVAASRGLTVTWTGPKEFAVPAGATFSDLVGDSAPGQPRSERLAALFHSQLDRPGASLQVLILPRADDSLRSARPDAPMLDSGINGDDSTRQRDLTRTLLQGLAVRSRPAGALLLALPYEAVAGSPLLVCLPGTAPAGPAAAPADLFDLAPTVSAALGLPSPAAAAGRPIPTAFPSPAALAPRLPNAVKAGVRLLHTLAADLGLDPSRVTPESLLAPGPGGRFDADLLALFRRAIDKREIGLKLSIRILFALLAAIALIVGYFLHGRGVRLPAGLPGVLLYLLLFIPLLRLALGNGTVDALLEPVRFAAATYQIVLLSFLYTVSFFLARTWFHAAHELGSHRGILRELDRNAALLSIALTVLLALVVAGQFDARLFSVRFPDAAGLRSLVASLYALHGALLGLLFNSLAFLALLYRITGRRTAD